MTCWVPARERERRLAFLGRVEGAWRSHPLFERALLPVVFSYADETWSDWLAGMEDARWVAARVSDMDVAL